MRRTELLDIIFPSTRARLFPFVPASDKPFTWRPSVNAPSLVLVSDIFALLTDTCLSDLQQNNGKHAKPGHSDYLLMHLSPRKNPGDEEPNTDNYAINESIPYIKILLALRFPALFTVASQNGRPPEKIALTEKVIRPHSEFEIQEINELGKRFRKSGKNIFEFDPAHQLELLRRGELPRAKL